MDPVTQFTLGAVAAQAVLGRRLVKHAWLIGGFAGMAADADVLIQSSADPLLAIEYHRHFTHALAFIPIGAGLTALPWLALRALRTHARAVLLAAFVGYATHGVLDACTTYGTRLLWPLSDLRVAWHVVSVIDPVVTLVLLAGLWFAVRRGRRAPAWAALALACAYLGLGALQHQRALTAVTQIAQSRAHDPQRVAAFPTLGNQILWRALYEHAGVLYAARVRVPWFGGAQWRAGASVERAGLEDLPPPARLHPRIRRDFDRFRGFSADWIARAPADPDVFGDARYSLEPLAFAPVWGVRFDPAADPPTEWVSRVRARRLDLAALWVEIVRGDAAYRPVTRVRTES